MGVSAGCVVRFFTRNDRGWKQLYYREIRQGASLEEAAAWAYHTIHRTSAERKAQIIQIEIQDMNGAVAIATQTEPEHGRAKQRSRR